MNQTKLNQINLSSIPLELKNLPHWVCWKSKEIIQGEKPTKIPINPNTGGYAKSNDSQTWGTFDDALKFYKSSGEKIDGIGFVVSSDDPFTGIDLDHCRNLEKGEMESRAVEIIKAINSYTEISPSGGGIRIFVKGKVPKGRKKGDIEVYSFGRFFTVTGSHLESMPTTIEPRQAELESFYKNYFGNDEPQQESIPKPSTPTSLPDQELIDKATQSKNGDKFQRLWKGDWTDYPSQSEADLALCQILAFWFGNNPGDINRMFRQSGLMRPKWDEKHFGDGRTYGQSTIQKTIERTTEVYSAPAKKGVEVFTNEDIIQIPNESISFPKGVITGVAGEFANLYSQYIEPPFLFLYFSFLCCLGSILSGKLISKSERSFQPRYYILLLGESADDRKSTAIEIPIEFFKEFFENALHVCWGVGSAEGLQLKINENLDGRLLLCVDELKALLNKCKIDGSVLLPCLNSLYEKNYYEAVTKTCKIEVPKAHLSILAASTIATYENIWTSQFIDIGFPNRIFIVPGRGERKHPIPQKVPYPLKNKMADRTKSIIDLVGNGFEMDIAPDAEKEFEGWYLSLGVEKTVHIKRLDTYALRFMSLLLLMMKRKLWTWKLFKKL